MVRITISVSPEFNALRKKFHLSWSEAARKGLSILLAQEGEPRYQNDLNSLFIVREQGTMLKKAAEMIRDLQQKLAEVQK